MRRPLPKILRPLERFLALEAASGILLALCTVVALILANSPWSGAYESFLHAKVAGLSVHHWINDGLMTVFFFVVGMEIKRELVHGELASPRQAALPIAAAIGGMVGPALLYLMFNPALPNLRGWGIPMATDIAFAVGVLSFFGARVPLPLKVFLLALAIVDDLGAVLVIAFFYTSEISGPFLGLAALALAGIVLLKEAGVGRYAVYGLLGLIAWYGVLRSGVHATIAGAVIGLLTPVAFEAKRGGKASTRPLDQLVHALHPYVGFFIMPIFALANAGVRVEGADASALLHHPIFAGVALGLLIGKPVGILLTCAFAVATGMASLPRGVRWSQLLGVGLLGGIGFTMALFVSALALSPDQAIYSKTGILTGSLAAAVAGSLVLYFTLPKTRSAK